MRDHDRPTLPDLPKIAVPAAIVDGESAEAARAAIAVIDEQGVLIRRFLREGAEFRRLTGDRVPTREWDAAYDRLHELARMRERIQEKLGRYRRQRTSFERAFVEVAAATLPPPVLAEITAAAQLVTRGIA